ncbi:MAG: acyl-[acyl-carrier-protein] thioesterase [Eubacterium sp.]|nr:acyl-[acyl-carrier-protein] thioesterase [Eubacterium sp.]
MIYEYESRVRYSEVDDHGEMTLFALMNVMQDCCTFHGEECGIGLAWNMERGCAWIIANLQLKIDRYPRYAEYIRVITWAPSFRGIIGRRNFRVEYPDGTRIAEGTSEWLYMDMVHLAPLRIPKEQGAYGLHPEKELTVETGKRKIFLPENMQEESPLTIRKYHIDTNNHVNNAQYIRISSYSLPAGFKPLGMRVEFKKPALLGDVIIPSTAPVSDGNGYFVCLADTEGAAYFTAEYTS